MNKKLKNKFNSLDMTLQFYIIVIESIIIILAIFYTCLYPVMLYKNREFIYENLKQDVDLIDDENINMDNTYPFAFIIMKGENYSEIIRSYNINEYVSYENQENIIKYPFTSNYYFNYLKDENKNYVYICTVKIDNVKICTIATDSVNKHFDIYKDDIYLIFFAAIIFFTFFLFTLHWVNKMSRSINKLNGFLLKYNNDFKDAPTSTKEINSLFRNFDDYRKTLMSKDNEKQVLFQNISHELRTPLTTIKMYGEALQDGIYNENNIQESAEIIIKESNILLEKVNKIMQINKLSYLEALNKGVTTLDKVSLSDILFEVMNNYNLISNNVKFITNLENINYRGTKEIWKNIIENIFDNNIRHKSTEIEITLNEKYLIIENNGEKIPQDLLPNVFEPFIKGVNGNYGLGLSIIKKSLDLYNYSIKVENSKKGVIYLITDNK